MPHNSMLLPLDAQARQKGAALIMVLWISLLLSVLMAGMLAKVRTETRITSVAKERLKAHEAMESATLLAAYRMARSKRNEAVLPFRTNLNGYDVTVTHSPEMQKLDLNFASERQLADHFQNLGINTADATSIAANIADWRDSDDLPRPNGAERRDYRGKGMDGPQNRGFLSVYELSLVLDMPEMVLDQYMDRFTVSGGRNSGKQQNLLLLPGTRVSLESSAVGTKSEITFGPTQTVIRATGLRNIVEVIR